MAERTEEEVVDVKIEILRLAEEARRSLRVAKMLAVGIDFTETGRQLQYAVDVSAEAVELVEMDIK